MSTGVLHRHRLFACAFLTVLATARMLQVEAQRQLAPPLGTEYSQRYEEKGPHFEVHADLGDRGNAAGPNLDVSITNTAPVNTSIDPILYPSAFAIRVRGPRGDVMPTLLGRQYFGPYLEGEDPGWSGSSYEPEITPGHTFTRHYRLSQFFDLTGPGDYEIYFLASDNQVRSPKGTWVKSNVLRYSVTRR